MIILYVILLILFIQLLWQRRHIYRLSWILDGPIGFPIVGSAFSVINPQSMIFLLKKNIFILIEIVLYTLPYLDKIAQKYSSPMRLWFGSKMLIFIADAENAEIVLKSKYCLNKSDIFYNVIRDSMCVDGILTSEGE